MAKVFALVQGLVDNSAHEDEIEHLIHSPWANEIFISVAFVRETGVSKIESALLTRNDITKILVGISNGITSKQALAKLLDVGVTIYVIDMGIQTSLFHPKLYAAIGTHQAATIVGSANLTSSGLGHNIEVSSKVELDLTEYYDNQYLSELIEPFRYLIDQHPQNVFQITTKNQLDELVSQGRLEDERFKKNAPIKGISSGNQSVIVPALPVHSGATSANIQPAHIQPTDSPYVIGWVWSKTLTNRDLGNPANSESNTHATAILGYSQGALRGRIDQLTYFRHVIFSELNWTPDAELKKSHLHRANANFELIINGIFKGTFNLQLTHDSNIKATTTSQSNIVTSMKWGRAISIIRNSNLIGRTINLYNLGGNTYQLEII